MPAKTAVASGAYAEGQRGDEGPGRDRGHQQRRQGRVSSSWKVLPSARRKSAARDRGYFRLAARDRGYCPLKRILRSKHHPRR